MKKRLFNQQSEPRSRETQKTWWLSVKAKIMMALLALMLIPQGAWALDYIKYDTATKKFKKASIDATDYTDLSNAKTSWAAETIVVSGNVVYTSDRIEVHGAVDLILCDGASLEASMGITVAHDATLTIYAQEKGTGQFITQGYTVDSSNGNGTGTYYGAAIGGYYDSNLASGSGWSSCGAIVIHGGKITANSSGIECAAGIGGCNSDGPVALTIYGGEITATGGLNGAGIGGGGSMSNGGTVSIYGGNVTATGGTYGAGIGGGGLSGNGGTVSIYGGEVIANGGIGEGANNINPAMGIGPGSFDTFSHPQGTFGTLYIGDNVTCYIGTGASSSVEVGEQANIANRDQTMKTDCQYALTVGGTPVKASIASNIFGSTSPATASFNATTNTLVLDGLSITSGNASIVSGLDDLTVEFSGTNVLGDGNVSSGYIQTTKSTATLTFKGDPASTSTLDLKANGNAVVEGFSSVSYNGAYWKYSGPITYNTASSRYETENNPLNLLTITTIPQYLVWISDTQVASDNYNTILDSQNNTSLIYDDASSTLTLDGCFISSYDCIKSALPVLNIKLKGDNTLHTYNNTRTPIVSSVSTAKLNIQKADGVNNCSLTLKTEGSDPVVKGFGTVTYDGLAYETTVGSGTTLDAIDTYGAKLSFTTYPLTVAGIPVTSANKGDVLGNGKVSYSHDATNNTYILKLNGATIAGGVVWSAGDDLIIELTGENSISNTSGDALLCTYTTSTPTVNFIAVGGTAVSSCKLTLTSGVGIYLPVNGFNINTGLYDLGVIDNGTAKTRVISSSPFSSGDGTYSNPYLIATPADLKNLAIYTNTGKLATNGLYFQITADLDCSGLTGFEPIGTATNPFQGTLEGLYGGEIKKIKNLSYSTSSTTADVGAFGVIGKVGGNAGSVSDVIFDNCTFSGGSRVGGVVGYLANGSIFQCSVLNSTISSAVANGPQVGGIAGAFANGKISVGSVGSCTITATADGSTPVAGGLVGRMDGGLIQSCLSDANTITSTSNVVAGDAYAAALVGFKTGGDFGTGGYRASYSSNVKTETNVAGASEPVVVKKSGNMPRGIGNMNDMSDQASLAEVFKTTLNYDLSICLAPTPKADTYYKYSDPDVYAARSTDVTIVVTPNDGFRPTLSLSDATTNNIPLKSSVDVNYASGDYSHTEFTFSMPSADVDATVGYNIDVSSNSFTPSIDKATYSPTGSLEPTKVNLKKGDTTYTLDATNNDFTISNATLDGNTVTEFNKAGTYSLTIQGGNGNIGTRAGIDYKVEAKNIADATINASVTGSYSYTGSPITPTLSVKDGSTDLVSGATGDYIVSYKMLVNGAYSDVASIIDAGAYQIVLKGQGNYKNERTLTLTVDAKSVDDVTIDAIPNQTYTGTSITPALTITDGSKTLNLTTDYTVAYKDNTEVGTATVTVTGTGNYTSSRDVTFKIEGKDASNFTVGRITDQIYSGSAITPTLTVSDGGKQLAQGTDYDVTFSNNVNVGTATATVTGIGNYTGSIPQTFSIIPKSIKGVSVTIGGIYTYTGAAIVPADADITVTDGTMTLDKDKDYTLSVTNNTNAGTATVTVTGKGNYDSATSEIGSFTIDQATITSVTLDQTQFVYAPGVAHSVNVTVMAGSLSVPSGSYTVTVDGVTGNSATAAGTHTVRATARTDIANNFKGYAETTFAITERTVSIDFGGRTFRTFYDGNETFLLPDGITAYIVTGVNGDAVTVKQVSYVLQGIPVLLESTPGTTNVADPAESFTGNLLKYAAAATPATDKHYVLYNNEFVRTSGTINGKVYLDLTGYNGSARALVIGDGTTGINVIVSDEGDGDVKWYDMQGRRINKPTKSGVYIKDGKKVVVKTRY